MKDFKTVKELAAKYDVTSMAVRHWLNKGLPYEMEKVIGIKPRIIIDVNEAEKFLKLTTRGD